MINKILYTLFKTAPNVRAAKALIATTVAFGLGALAQSLLEGGWEIPAIFTTVFPPIILMAEKWIQAWGQNAQR